MATYKRKRANVQRICLVVACAAVVGLAVGLGLSLAANAQNSARSESLMQENKQLQSALAEESARVSSLEQLTTTTTAPTTTTTTSPTDPTSPPDDGRKLVALTFDDGPGGTTAALLDELKARGMKATFFMVANRVNAYPDTVKRMVAEGHEVASHSYQHAAIAKMSVDACREDLTKAQDAIERVAGVAPRLLRPPGGSTSDTLRTVTAQMGLRMINWSVDTQDWKSRDPQAIFDTAFQDGPYGIRDGAIVLMHDIYSSTVDGAVRILDRLQEEGYTCVTVSELLEARQGGGTAGELYTFVGK